MSEGIEKCSKKSRSSSSWIRSTIQEILKKNKGVAEEEEEGFSRDELVNQLLILMTQNDVKKEAKGRRKVESMVEKLSENAKLP